MIKKDRPVYERVAYEIAIQIANGKVVEGAKINSAVQAATSLEDLIHKVKKLFYRRNFVQDIIAEVDESDIDVPIVDVKGRLRGLINGSDVLKIMK